MGAEALAPRKGSRRLPTARRGSRPCLRRVGWLSRLREQGDHAMSPIIKYDVSNVLPFPLGRDPGIQGLKRRTRWRRKPVELPIELEAYRFYTVEELDEFAPVTWLIPSYLARGELTGLYGKG